MPALLGLPALIAFFSSTLSAFIVWFVANMSRKIAVLLAALIAISVAVIALFDFFKDAIAKLLVSAPPELISASHFLPSNTGTCIAIILGAETACAIYSLTMRLIKLKVDAVS